MKTKTNPVSLSASPRTWATLLASALTFALAGSCQAGIFDFFGGKGGPAKKTAAAVTGALSNDQVIAGLKEALGNGLRQAVDQLGRDGGFLTNLSVKIPVPEKLQKIERLARAAGQDKLADEFIASLNHAAEKAVPEAAAVFGDALRQMSIDDAKKILTGAPDAATQFFVRTTRTNLYTRFHPLVEKATAEVGVTGAYKNLAAKAESADSLGGGLVGALRKSVTDQKAPDLDGYVTDKALDGLFKLVAEEEKRIRENPVARTTELLKSVFGSLGK